MSSRGESSASPWGARLADLHWRGLTWWIVLRTALAERLAYRGDFALGTLMRFLPIITQIFLWWAIFESVGVAVVQRQASSVATAVGEPVGSEPVGSEPAPEAAERGRIVGYAFPDMVAYYLLTMLARAFSSMPGLAPGISRSIRQGDVKKYLIQPVDMVGFLLLGRVAHKLAYYAVATLPFALVFFLCRGYFVAGWPSAEIMLAFVLSLLLGFLLGFFLEACIGLVAFWFLEVSSLLFIYMLLSFFLSGHMFPLDMLPAPWSQLVDLLPLKYLAYFPSAVFLGRVPAERLWWDLAIEAVWVLGLAVLARWLYLRGVRRYSGFGG
jgi:ABC-2 type transport system permease protein